MAQIDMSSGSASAYGAGELQLQNKAPMDGTLRFVTDSANTASPLKLSTSLVQSTSTIKITTSDVAYIDAEDNSGNNRFTVSRASASQLVTVDFASVPTVLTTAVGAIRTATDGVNLANVMTFLENGKVGIGTDTPTSKFQIVTDDATVTTSFSNQTTGLAGTATQGLMAAYSSTNGGYINAINPGIAWLPINYGALKYIFSTTGTNRAILDSSGDLTIGNAATTLSARVGIKGSGSTSATTSLLVQNSAGTQLLNIRDDGFTTIGQSNQGISTHNLTATNYIVCGSTSAHYFQLGAGLVLRSPSDGVATFLNGGESGFTRINLGGTTSSFPAIKRNGTAIDIRLADDSNYAALNTGATLVKGSGATSATTSLLVQNSAGSTALTVKDDLSVGVNAQTQVCFAEGSINDNRGIRFLSNLGSGFSYIDGYAEGTNKAQNYPLFIGSRVNNTGSAITGSTTAENGTQTIFGYAVNEASSLVTINSTTRGFLPPRMTTVQINAIATPAEGLVAFNTTISHLCCYQAGAWVKFSHSPM